MNTVIGKITLRDRFEFTQYGEHAAWTDYVTCEPQTAELKIDDYWVFARFNGTLTKSTYPSGSREIGKADTAGIQTQQWGGIGDWMSRYDIEITNPNYSVRQVGSYEDGSPMLAIQRINS